MSLQQWMHESVKNKSADSCDGAEKHQQRQQRQDLSTIVGREQMTGELSASQRCREQSITCSCYGKPTLAVAPNATLIAQSMNGYSDAVSASDWVIKTAHY
jgi:hypothetical protein